MAASDINSVTVSGNLVKDAEFRQVGQSGVLNFTVASNEPQKNQDGTWGSYANFIDISYFSKGAQNLVQYLKKGSSIAVQGKMHQDRWEKDGQKNSRIVIRADNIKLCGGNKGASNSNGNSGDGFHEDLPFTSDGSNSGIPF